MTMLSIKDVIPGFKLKSDVLTELGSVLLSKGQVLLPRDLEILHAFLIKEVEIEMDQTVEGYKALEGNKQAAKQQDKNKENVALAFSNFTTEENEWEKFNEAYDKTLALVKQAFHLVLVSELPVLELRTRLKEMFNYIHKYNVITFTPQSMSESDYIYHNAVMCSLTSYLLAQWAGLPQKDWIPAAFAGLLHDIGNAKVDHNILHKPSALTPEEAAEMRQHTIYGYELLSKVKGINEGVRLAALQHHEKVDGSGYPMKIKGQQTHIYARIASVADIFHAMTLQKAYRKAQSPYLVLEQIKSEAFGKLDPAIVQTFISKATQLGMGTKIRLNDQRTGEIVFADRDYPTRPMVNIDGEIINLVQNTNLYIEEIIS
ncbi:HD-GYP domain-containing protein [Paenibacillus terreus]|uniref:HD-GYP domain-containing protein n=1 Tax=Paenibacillus terreus TaxID=1387834 RepID=A0ABV5BDB6_9BACL